MRKEDPLLLDRDPTAAQTGSTSSRIRGLHVGHGRHHRATAAYVELAGIMYTCIQIFDNCPYYRVPILG